MNESIRVGDRVRIRTAYYHWHRHLGSREGTVVRVEGEYTGRPMYHVGVHGYGEIPTMAVEKIVLDAAIGDRVIVREVRPGFMQDRVGMTGEVLRAAHEDYLVKLDGFPHRVTVCAKRVEKVEEPHDEPLADWEKEILSAEEQAAAVSELPLANLQAATFAHQLLGDSADLDKLIGVAEFAMGRRTLGTETTGTVTVGDVNIYVPATSAAPEDKLTITDEDGDRVEFAARERDNPDGVNVTVYEDGDRATAYLTKDDLARVVAFLEGHRRTFTTSA